MLDSTLARDRGLVTSRKPDDLPALKRRMIEEIAEGSPTSRTERSTVET